MRGSYNSSGPSVLIRVDASARIGGGHVMRCLSLADELANRGAEVAFACASIPDGLAARVMEAGHRIFRIEPVSELLEETTRWEGAILSPDAQRLDAERSAHSVPGADWIVLDHYRLDDSWLQVVQSARKLVVDDLANRPAHCDILVDQTFGRLSSDYSALVRPNSRVLAGASYAMLLPEFALARTHGLLRRREGKTERLLISMGTSDIDGITLKALASVLAAGIGCDIDVVLSSSAPSLEPVRALARQNARISLHVDTRNMVSLMVAADLAVGASGISSWERCCLGLPAVTVVVADNQRLVSKTLAEAGAVVAVDSPSAIGGAIAALIADPVARAGMIAAAAAIIDGKGAQRVADVMLGERSETSSRALELRDVQASDSIHLWLWRNAPQARAMSKSEEPIAWAGHDRWFSGVMSTSSNSRLFVADLRGVPVAMVRFDRQDGGALVSINVDPAARGRGIGKAALIAACDRYEGEQDARLLEAEIRPANEPSIRVFEAADFRRAPEQSREFLRFVRRRRAATATGTE